MVDNSSKRTRRITLPFASVDEKPYIFASYGHDDKEIVFPLLKQLYEEGYNVWYDEGITIGEKYDEVIENHIRQSAVFILFASSLSLSRPYVTEVEIKIANDNLNNVPVLTLYIEDGLLACNDIDISLPEQRFNDISQVIEHLKSINLQNFGKRTAVPIERDVPDFWFDGHDIDPAGGTKNAVYSEDAPYACIAFHPGDLIYCNPYIKELYFAGYNVRSCENSNRQERTDMIKSSDCMAYVPFVTKKYIESGQLEQDYDIAKNSGKHLIGLYIPTYDRNGNEERVELPSSISEEFSLIQGLNLKELTNNDFLSKLEIELEKRKCYASEKDGKVERRSFEIKDFLYDFTEDRKGIVLTQYRDETASVVIKTAYSGFPVREIGNSAFSGYRSLTCVKIPDSVTRIGNSAFHDCSSLTDITIPDSITSIGSSAFSRCSSLTNIIIPDSVTSIGVKAFKNCSSLNVITIPDSVERIEYGAFSNCSSLTNITVSAGNKSYCDLDGILFNKIKNTLVAFPCARSGEFYIPDGVTDVGFGAFHGCSSLTCITIPDSVMFIEAGVFSGCSSLNGFAVSNGNKYYCDVDGVLFNKMKKRLLAFPCARLGEYCIPDSVTDVGDGAFCGCCSLIGITIPDSVTDIGAEAFSGCSSLIGITIPGKVKSFGHGVLSGCNRLTGITIPDSVTSIGNSAFYGCSSLTGITIPDSVTSIGYGAFDGCNRLTGITIPDSVTSIGYGAFSDCISLTVRCSENSFAWQYCEKNNIKHEHLASELTTHKESAHQATEEVSAALAEVPAAPDTPQEKTLASTPRKKSPARWLVPVLILLALVAIAGLQLSGLVDILGLLGL